MAPESLALSAVCELRTCSRCKVERPSAEFYKDKRRASGLSPQCKFCAAHYRESADKEKAKEYFREYGQANKALIAAKNAKHRQDEIRKRAAKAYAADYYKKNKARLNARSVEYQKANRKSLAEQLVARYRSDPVFRMGRALRSMLRTLLISTGQKKRSSSYSLLGYGPRELRAHIERQFAPGMNWEKMGREIHIDHIIPVAEFLRAGETRPDVIHALPNLRPMWAVENLSKSDKRLHLL